MKAYIKILMGLLIIMLPVISSCDENDPLPDYEIVGRSYETLASIAVSDDEPAAGESIVVTLEYVNYSEDPAQSVTLLVERDGTQTTLQTFDESGAGEGVRTLSYTYAIPADAGGESLTFIGEFRSSLEFPQIESTGISVE